MENLEADAEQLRKKDQSSKAKEILEWTVGIFEIAAAIVSIIEMLTN